MREPFLIKLQGEAYNFLKRETSVQVFSCEFCGISKNTFPYRTPPVTASFSKTFNVVPRLFICLRLRIIE